MITNASALKSLCNAICNTFYVDDATIEMSLFNEGIEAEQEAEPKDVRLLRLAISLCFGYVEGSRTENGVSTSVLESRVKESIRYWCRFYGLDLDEELQDYVKIIKDGSNLW